MPRVAEFFGIAIFMYFNDHVPPHFHAEYGEFEAVYAIDTLDVLRGSLPRRAHVMVVEWALAHRAEVRAGWSRAREGLSLEQIEPLD